MMEMLEAVVDVTVIDSEDGGSCDSDGHWGVTEVMVVVMVHVMMLPVVMMLGMVGVSDSSSSDGGSHVTVVGGSDDDEGNGDVYGACRRVAERLRIPCLCSGLDSTLAYCVAEQATSKSSHGMELEWWLRVKGTCCLWQKTHV